MDELNDAQRAAIDARAELKGRASLQQIQLDYFDLLIGTFGQLFDQMKSKDWNPHTAAVAVSRDPPFVANITAMIPGFMEVLTDFWEGAAEIAHLHVEDSAATKAIFGGDLFPTADENIASTCGVYLDTIVLPDPLIRAATLFRLWSAERQAYYFVKCALNVLKYRDLAIADVDPPIIVVLPDRVLLNDEDWQVMDRVARADAVKHAAVVFDAGFESYDELLSYLGGLSDTAAVVSRVKRPDRVLFDVDWSGSVAEQIARMAIEHPEVGAVMGGPAGVIASQAYGRMAQSNDLLLRSQRLKGVPLVDALTSWKYFQWKLEYDSTRLPESALPDLHVVRALRAAESSGRVRWIGKVPEDALIQLRKDKMLPELREMIGDGVQSLATADSRDFGRTADVVVANIEAALAKQNEKLDELASRKWGFALKDVGAWIAIGGVEVTAAATGMPMYGLAAFAANQLYEVPKLKDLPAKLREIVEDGEKVRRSPVGLLFKLSNE